MSAAQHGIGPEDKAYRRILIAFFGAGLATWALLFNAQAVLPAMAAAFEVSASTVALSVSLATLGFAVAVLPWSAVSDRLGRSRAMQISILGTSVISLASVFAPTLETFLVARLLLGIMLAGVPAVSVAYLAEEIQRKKLPATVGVFVAGNTVGGMLGRLVAGPIAEMWGWREGIAATSVIGIVAAVLFIAMIPGSSGRALTSSSGQEDLPMRAKIMTNLRDPKIRVLYALGFIVLGTFTAVYNYLAFRLINELHMSGTVASLLFLGIAFGTLGSALGGSLVEPWGGRRTVVVGFVIAIVGASLFFAHSPPVVFVGLALLTLGVFVVNAIVYGWVGQRATVGKGQATAMFQLFNQTGNALIGWAAGVVYGQFGWTPTVCSLLVLLVIGAAVALVGLPQDKSPQAAHKEGGPADSVPSFEPPTRSHPSHRTI